jgi:magnesium transporter
VIVDCALYEDGTRVPGRLALREAYARAQAHPDAFVWIGLHEPSFAEFDDVTDVLGLHPLAVEDAVKAHQRPKLEQFDDSLFVVLITAWYVDPTEVIDFGEVMLFLGDHFVVTVRHGTENSLADTRKELEVDADKLRWGPISVLYAVVDRVVDGYQDVLDGLDNDIDEIETQVFSGGRRNHAERIFKLKREVLDFRRAMRPLVSPLEDISHGKLRWVHQESGAYFRDVLDHLVRVADHVDSYENILVSALNANLAQVGVQQNEDMRKMSAWAGLITVPTLIAGIYGMNFEHMPELTWYLGYPFSLGTMLLVCWLLYRNFKRSGWL